MRRKEKINEFSIPVKAVQIDGGCFGNIYRISPRRVLKVYDCVNEREGIKLAEDERKGAGLYYNGLPVLRIVRVKLRGAYRIGVIKRYLPREVDYDAVQWICDVNKQDRCDFGERQYRADSRGRIYRVDTQTDDVLANY